MSWILTKTRVEFDYDNPTPEKINVPDIARSLSNTKRFNGHGDLNCSVALHSVIMSHIVPYRYAKHALLHDAHEAYVGDLPKPLKAFLGTRFHELVRKIDLAVGERFNVSLEKTTIIRLHDLSHLKYEKERLFGTSGRPWPCLVGIQACIVSGRLAEFYRNFDCRDHEDLFLSRCMQLGVQ